MLEVFAAGESATQLTILQIAVPSTISVILAAAAAWAILARYQQKVDTLEKKSEKDDEKIAKLRTDADQLLEFKTQAQKFIDKNIYKDQSPLSLTELGKSLVTDSGFTQIFEQVKDNLVEMLEEMQPSSQYETQEKARALMDSLADYQPFRPIQQYAFDHGKDLNQILRAGAIMLRDYYFEKHPEVVDPKEDW